jgi:VanZ family protein
MSAGRRVRRVWWLSAAVLVAAGAAYVSLVPFGFVAPAQPLTAAYAWQLMLADTNGASHVDLIANALMTFPFGLCATAAVADDRPRAWRWLLAGLAVLIVSIVLSVTIETLQIFVPGRTPSLADIEAQTIGTGIGALAWFLMGREVLVLCSRLASGSRRSIDLVLAGYAAVQFFLLVEPFDVTVEPSDLAAKFHRGGIVIDPLRSPTLRWESLPSNIASLLLAAPLGFLAGTALRSRGVRRWWPIAIAAGVAFYAAGEFAQVLVQSRNADVVDVLVNVTGVLAGVLLLRLLRPDVSVRGTVERTGIWLTVAIVTAAAMYVAYNWSPFDFVFSGEQIRSRAGMLARVPFYAYYVNPEIKALRDACLKISLALPLGVLFQLRWRPEQTSAPRLVTAGWLMLTAFFFTGVEIGQMFLPSRFPDDSDILLGVFAVWLGLIGTRPFTRRSRGGVDG